MVKFKNVYLFILIIFRNHFNLDLSKLNKWFLSISTFKFKAHFVHVTSILERYFLIVVVIFDLTQCLFTIWSSSSITGVWTSSLKSLISGIS